MNNVPLKIRLYGDPCLRRKLVLVDSVGKDERSLIKSMIVTMRESKGVGLAAPQVGVNKQIFVADVGDGPLAFINAKIIKRIGTSVLEEGCLSIPGISVSIRRPAKVLVRYINEKNEPIEKLYEELMARVIQHEMDHLEGRLIVDYASIKERLEMRKQLKEIEAKQKG